MSKREDEIMLWIFEIKLIQSVSNCAHCLHYYDDILWHWRGWDGGIISLSAALLGGCGDNVRAPRARALCGAPRNCNNQHNETIPLLLPCCVQLPCQLCQLRKNDLKNTFTSKLLWLAIMICIQQEDQWYWCFKNEPIFKFPDCRNLTLLFWSRARTVSPQPWAAAVGGGREAATDRGGGDAFQQEATTFCGTMWHKMNYFKSSISVLILLSFVKCDELDDETLQALLENHLTESGSHVVINHCLDTKENQLSLL